MLSLSRSSAQVSRLSPLFVIPAKAGTQRSANGKTGAKPKGNAINQNVPDLGSRFRGNDEKRDCVLAPMRKNSSKIYPQILSKNQKKQQMNHTEDSFWQRL
jgi:hypothetical protein